MDDAKPAVTLGLPVYNCADTLPTCIDSLLAQSFTDFELVIADNTSSDATPDIARDYQKRDARVRYVRHERNRGFSHNMNFLFRSARGRYLMCTGGKDFRPRDALAQSFAVLEQNPGAALCYGRTTGVDGSAHYAVAPDDLDCAALDPAARFEHVVRNMSRGDVVYGLIRLAALRETRLFRNVYGHDHVLISEVALQGSLVHLPRPTLYRREPRLGAAARRSVSQTLAMIDPGIGALHRRFPFRMMIWEHLLGLWRSSLPLPQKIRLTRKARRILRRRFQSSLADELPGLWRRHAG